MNSKTNENAAIDTSSILRCYTLVAIGLPLTFVSFGLLSSIAMIVLMFGFIWAWRMKRRDDALFANHGRWMVRTVSISSLFMLIATMLAGVIVSSNADRTAIDKMAALQASGEGTSQQIVELLNEYSRVNFDLMLYTVLGCLALPFAYSLMRFAKGYRLADAGKPVENLTTWRV